ncbi:unnamed protein product [Paramecium primaurelia]|uniref:Myosin motor domain-containing protein n=1 Tax=Paramecium primaurelia TaxID=5886 RepID=A0A8S1P9P7_PARPR|nr:unnamed protein product [Paramecium primaurelia]
MFPLNNNDSALLKSTQYHNDSSQNQFSTPFQYQSQNLVRQNDYKELLPSNIADIDHPDNIITLLEKTFQNGQIYIDLGQNTLISLNPFQNTNHLSDTLIQSYKKDFLNKSATQQNYLSQPHIYKLAELAKQACWSKNNIYNTCSILTQGISGSGKTVASKAILEYIAADSKSGLYISSTLNKVEIEQRIISSDIIFEAFGNAKTQKNSNSSRFGKVVSIQFEKNGKISSGKIMTTLFERTRLTQNRYIDRNYHIFYYLFTAYHKIQDLKSFAKSQEDVKYDIVKLVEEISKLDLDSEFMLLGIQNQILISQDDQNNIEEEQRQSNEDFLNFTKLLLAFDDLDFSLEEIVNIFKCIAGLIHLKEDNYVKAEEFLMIPNLQQTINSNIEMSRLSKKLQSESIVNGIIMDFYYKLFSWIQNKININLSQDYDVNKKHILNVFDSFGFEIFENEYGIQQNQFEQLMLNYINEKLQSFYYFSIAENAQKKFQSENLNLLKVDFQKNDKVISVIEDVIFTSIKDCIKLQRSTQNLKDIIKKQTQEKNLQDILIDETQLKKKQEKLTQSQITHKFLQNIICIRHTGGEVYYQLDGFIQNNKYTISQDIQNINKMSSNSIIKSFTQQSQTQTVSDITQKDINEIIQQFKKSETWFIKCFQTNYQQMPQNFDKIAMKTQLSQSGIEQCFQLLYQTYLLSIPNEEFFNTYQIIYPNTKNLDEWKNALNQQFQDQNNIQFLYFGSNNVLIKEQLKRDFDFRRDQMIQNQQNLPYLEIQLRQQYDEQIEMILADNEKKIQELNIKIEIKEKEAKYQQQRADYLEALQKKMIQIFEKTQGYYTQQMEELKQIKQECDNNIQALNQTYEGYSNLKNQENGKILIFGQIQDKSQQ